MKNFSRLILPSVLMVLAFSSCTKQIDVVPQPPATNSNGAASLNELTTSDNFDWSTTKKVNFTFEGDLSEEYNLLLQVSDANGNVFLQKMQKSNQTFKVTLSIPANEKTVTIHYGADSKTIDCSTNTATVNINQF